MNADDDAPAADAAARTPRASRVPRGLYAITADALLDDPARLVAAVDAVLRGGAAMLQFRAKRLAPESRPALAEAVLHHCRASGVPLIVNDDVALAHAIGADGVHLGRDDDSVEHARSVLGARAIIGVSCNNDARRALGAAAAGVDYLALGRFYASRSKPEAPPAPLALLATVRAQVDVPICVIGGLTPDNVAPLVAGGADLFAAIDALFSVPDVLAATRRFVAALG